MQISLLCCVLVNYHAYFIMKILYYEDYLIVTNLANLLHASNTQTQQKYNIIMGYKKPKRQRCHNGFICPTCDIAAGDFTI